MKWLSIDARGWRVALAAALLAAGVNLAAQPVQELAGGKDLPAVSRFAGAVLYAQSDQPFEKVRVALGPTEGWDYQTKQPKLQKEQAVEGRVLRSVYIAPAGTSGAEVFRNYEKALSGGGFTLLYACEGNACGKAPSHGSVYDNQMPKLPVSGAKGTARFSDMKDAHYVVARGGTAAQPLWVLVNIGRFEQRGSRSTAARPSTRS